MITRRLADEHHLGMRISFAGHSIARIQVEIALPAIPHLSRYTIEDFLRRHDCPPHLNRIVPQCLVSAPPKNTIAHRATPGAARRVNTPSTPFAYKHTFRISAILSHTSTPFAYLLY